jgi:hypothetical protein
MLASIWAFLQDDSTRPVLAWIGGPQADEGGAMEKAA